MDRISDVITSLSLLVWYFPKTSSTGSEDDPSSTGTGSVPGDTARLHELGRPPEILIPERRLTDVRAASKISFEIINTYCSDERAMVCVVDRTVDDIQKDGAADGSR